MRLWTSFQRRAFFSIVSLGLVLRAYTLVSQPFWSDEWYYMKMVTQRTLFQDMLMPLVTDLYPPFFFLCTWFSTRFGTSLWELRFFSFAGGVASVALVYIIARRWGGTRAAIYAGLLAALSPMGVYYSQEFKLYSFLSAMNLWVLYEALRSLEGPKLRWKRLALATALSMYTYYLTPYLLFPLVLAALIFWKRGPKAQGAAALKGMGVGLLWSLPLFPFFVKTVMTFSAQFFDIGKHWLLWYSAQNYSTGFIAPQALAEAAALLFMAMILLNLRRRGAQAWAVAVIVAFAVLPSVLQFVQAELLKPSYSDRAMLGAAYAWALAAGLGLATVDAWLAGLLLAVALSINAYSLSLHYDPATRSRYDFQAAYEALRVDWRPGDAVIHDDQQSLFPFNYQERQDHSGMISYEKTDDPGFPYNEAMQGGRRYWRLVNAWLKAHDWGIDSGIDPYRVFGDRLKDVAVGDAQRLWYVVPSVPVLSRAWNPMLNLWRNHAVSNQPFDPLKEAWLPQMGFHFVSKHELSPGIDVYLFERKPLSKPKHA